jgi:hypothetical protein
MLGAGVAGDRRWKMRGKPGMLDHIRPCFLRHRLMLPADVTIEKDTASLQ